VDCAGRGAGAGAAGDDLAVTERSFVVRAPDGFAIAFGGALGAALATDMPRAQLRFVTEAQDDAGALRDGRIDIDIGTFRPRDPEIEVVGLFPQALIAVVRAGHPFAARPATARRYAAQAHVDVQRRPGAPSAVDDALAALGWRGVWCSPWRTPARRPVVAARGDFVATLSERLARAMAPGLGLVVVPLPFLPRGETVVMAWHPRHAADPAHAWLRRQVLRAIAAAGAARGHRWSRPLRLEPRAAHTAPDPKRILRRANVELARHLVRTSTAAQRFIVSNNALLGRRFLGSAEWPRLLTESGRIGHPPRQPTDRSAS